MLKHEKIDGTPNSNQNIYISVDHLKHGSYTINIMLNNKVVKSVEINKTAL